MIEQERWNALNFNTNVATSDAFTAEAVMLKKGVNMKIAISSTKPNPDARVDLRFGRCRCFALVDVDTDIYDFIDNDAAALSGGAGLQAAQMLADAGVNAVITGNIGPNASNVLEAAGIKTYLCNTGTVGEVLQEYRNGGLAESSGHTVSSHFGSEAMGRGMGGGMGQGRGGGQGGGRGGGRGRR
jgi:predicted Fe-Mo cluster-binding NifX family protein